MKINIKYANIQHGRVRAQPDGSVNITVPNRKKNDTVFVSRLIKKGEQLSAKIQSRPNLKPVNDIDVYFFGQKMNRSDMSNKQLDKYLRKELLSVIQKMVEHYASMINKKVNKITIKKLKSKRGSCSSDRNLVFNLKLVHLDLEYIEYVVIHEICHLKHQNHSSKFRELVQSLMPDFKQYRKYLRQIIILD